MRKTYQIRVCTNPECGLRYPLLEGQNFGERCPACLGETQSVLQETLTVEHAASSPAARRAGPAVLLDNIRSAWNVGSILRTADGFGFAHAYLCGISAPPRSPDVRKTSLGAEDSVEWSIHPDGLRLCRQLKAQGFSILALETTEAAQDLSKWNPRPDLLVSQMVLVLGSEVTGIDPEILQLSDEIVSLPMFGEKRSFNVAVAFGIAAYQICQKSA